MSAEEWLGPDRRNKLDPDDARAVLSVLVEHLESEDYLSRALKELRGTVGSVSGELARITDGMAAMQAEVSQLRQAADRATKEVARLATSVDAHIKQARPMLKATESVMVLARAGDLLWRLKWWGVALIVMLWALIKGDMHAILRALALLQGHAVP